MATIFFYRVFKMEDNFRYKLNHTVYLVQFAYRAFVCIVLQIVAFAPANTQIEYLKGKNNYYKFGYICFY